MDSPILPPSYEASGVLQNHDYYIRLVTMINHATLELYYKIFHESTDYGFSIEPSELNQQLKTFETKFQRMQKEGKITTEEMDLLFPASKETYSQEFSIPLFHKLCEVCLLTWGENNNMENKHRTKCLKLFDALEKIKEIHQADNLMNIKDADHFEDVWNKVMEILETINYDVNKLTELRTDSIDNKRFRFALIKTEMDLFLRAINRLLKTIQINTFTLDKLLLNQREVINEYQEEFKENDVSFSDYPLLHLKDDIELTSTMLETLKNNVKLLFPDMKLWREKNVEGDIIVVDEKLSKLKNQVNEQSFNVSNFFNSISFDIVKMKERMNHHDKNEQYIVNTMERKISSTLTLTRSRDNVNFTKQLRTSPVK